MSRINSSWSNGEVLPVPPSLKTNFAWQSESGRSVLSVAKNRAFSMPLVAAITIEVFLSCIIITTALLVVSTTNTSASNDLCIKQGVDSVQSLVSDIQSRTSDLVAERLLTIVAGPVNSIRDTDRLQRLSMVDPTKYDALLPYFRQQILLNDAVSLVYYGDATTKDFVGVRRQLPDAPRRFGYDLMDESHLLRQPSRCPQTCPSAVENENRTGIRYKYYIDDNGKIVGDAYSSAAFDPTSRAWFTLARDKGGPKIPVWTDAYVFSNKIDIGITASIPIYSSTDATTADRIVGVMAADMSFAVLKEQLRSLPFTQNGFVLVFDQKGTLYGSSVVSENVTIANDAGVSDIKSIKQLTDPKSKYALNYILSQLPSNGVSSTSNSTLDLSGLSTKQYRAPYDASLASALGGSDLSILLREVKDSYGLKVFVLVGAPFRDYTGGIDDTGVTLRDKLNGNVRLMLVIGAIIVVAFVLLSIPVTHYTITAPLKMLAKHMEEVARFDFGSLHGKDRNQRSIIKELGMMQTAYWNMIMKFANGIQENRRLAQGGKSSTAHVSSYNFPDTSKN
ncbi:Adenylate cyclase 1 [Phlyctochytrium planicorne]|nr:Adenylate cyclase 1 [Phlyctochytrium planicorne]